MAVKQSSNQLVQETSPYLLQHANNPVDWHPWSSEALAKARAEKKPIFLSIGYSACHWCHVMAHESFEDEASAKVLNELFVNIKVDREERPDIDRIYQHAYRLLNGRAGGWPLSMVLTPDDQAPFFGATYLPKEPRYGMPAFTDLMAKLAEYFKTREGELRDQNEKLLKALRAGPPQHGRTGYSLNSTPLDDVIPALADSFDADNGGFGKAPKFPQPLILERLLRHWHHTERNGSPDKKSGQIAKFTLEKMAEGGMYDQLSGGFCRYSVDERWMIPHFEKMLYDNALLLPLYAQAWRATELPLFKQVVEETTDWVMREMQAPAGGFYSSLDADSEGEEGKFYAWTPTEIEALLSPEQYSVFAPRYGLDQASNFEGKWHLYCAKDSQQVAKKMGMDTDAAEVLLDQAKQTLLHSREQRIRPGLDDKILTSWNGLMIKGLANASRLLDRPDYAEQAERALDFIRAELWQDGRLLAVHKDGRSRFPAYLDDYAFLIDAILELLQCRWRDGDLGFALDLSEVVLSRFQDPRKKGGFYFTADDHETLIHRPKPVEDDATPAGGGIAAHAMIRLGHLTNTLRYLLASERALKSEWPSVERYPASCCAMLLALEEYYFPPQTIVIRGERDAIEPWRQACASEFAPRRLTLAIPNDAQDLPEFLALRTPQDNVVAYVCSGTQCSAPVTDLDELLQELKQPEATAA